MIRCSSVKHLILDINVKSSVKYLTWGHQCHVRLFITNGAYNESWIFAGTTLSEMPTSVALPISHHFHPSLSPVVSLSVGILHQWMRMQMLAKPSSNLLQRIGGDHRGGRAQPGWRTFIMTCLRWILGYMRLEIWCKICLSGWRVMSLHSATHL